MIHAIIDLSSLLLCYLKSWNILFTTTLCTISRIMTSYLRVPEGTVLGPLMFLLFIDDIQDDLECNLRLFADDTLLFHKITHHDDTLALQRDLDKLGLWADRWQMLFNPSKCYKMSVFRSRSPLA